jgi:hypothetical protein
VAPEPKTEQPRVVVRLACANLRSARRDDGPSLRSTANSNARICRGARLQNQSEVSVRPSSYVQVKPGGDHDHSNATEDA